MLCMVTTAVSPELHAGKHKDQIKGKIYHLQGRLRRYDNPHQQKP